MRGNNKAFSRATVFHELIPGHHLQGFMTQRFNAHRAFRDAVLDGGLGAAIGRCCSGTSGFPSTPEQRVGALFWRMHRCARIIFSLKFHWGTMTAGGVRRLPGRPRRPRARQCQS